MPLSQFNCRAHKICFRRPQKNTFGRRVINILLRMRDAAYFFFTASSGREVIRQPWLGQGNWIRFFVGVAKNERFGSNRFDTHRATEFNWHLVGGRAHRKEQILFSNGRGESLEKIFPSRVEHVAFYYLASGNKYRSRHWIPFYIRVFRTYRGVLIM